MLRRIGIFVFFLLLASGLVSNYLHAQEVRKPAWQSIEEAMEASSYSRQHIVVDIYAPWCGWCERIEKNVHTRDNVRSYLETNFELARIDLSDEHSRFHYKDEELSSAELASLFNATGTPTTVFLAPDGSYITRLPGYVDSEVYLLVLKFIAEEAYRVMDFPEYQEQHM